MQTSVCLISLEHTNKGTNRFKKALNLLLAATSGGCYQKNSHRDSTCQDWLLGYL